MNLHTTPNHRAMSGPYRRPQKAPVKTRLLAIGALIVAAYWIGWR